MDIERPQRSTSHNTNNSTNELFVCFTSRLSSSSMKISTKSILSPGRAARDSSQVSLSSSLSRRLKNSGSLKGGQASPMFPTVGKKRGCAFENPEPSSPKVTCIGQVRVKTKKQGKKMRLRSKRRQGDVSFRRVEQNSNSNSTEFGALRRSHSIHSQQQQPQECLPHRNQRWVHLPLTICEALRAVGSEFNCFLPCRSSCMSSTSCEKDKAGRSGHNGDATTCGAMFARWLVSLQEGDVKEREIELVVGEEESPERTSSGRSRRRHVFEDIEINEDDDDKFGGQEQARVSICIPPKNALLLMRCGSDPVKMAALANRFCESDYPNDEDGKVEDEAVVEKQECIEKRKEAEPPEAECKEDEIVHEKCVVSEEQEIQVEEENTEDKSEESPEIGDEEEHQETITTDTQLSAEDGVTQLSTCTSEKALQVPESQETEEHEEQHDTVIIAQQTEEHAEQHDSVIIAEQVLLQEEEEEDSEEEEPSLCSSFLASLLHSESESETEELREAEHEEAMPEEVQAEEKASSSSTHESQESESDPEIRIDNPGQQSKDTNSQQETQTSSSSSVLPDCLLLMMCEPKLSMEVSKETWVCSTDFIRWPPSRHVTTNKNNKKSDGPEEQQQEEPKKRLSVDSISIPSRPSAKQLHQPPRSSCHYPSAASARLGAESMANMIEQKLVNSKAYEPFVLTRCKSEPMSSSAKFAPDGVGAAGVGF